MPEPTPARFVRVDRGTQHWYTTTEGKKLAGVTTILDHGLARPGLKYWAAYETAGYAVRNWDELADLRPDEREDALRAVINDKTAIRRGSAIHAVAEAMVGGRPVDVPEELASPAQAVARWMDAWEMEPILNEVSVAHLSLGYAGTFDALARLRDGRVWLLDYKTGKGVYPDVALQLAAYRNAQAYLVEGGELPMPDVDACGAVHIGEDFCRLHPVQADDFAWRTFQYVMQSARWFETWDGRNAPSPVGAPIKATL